MSTYSRLRELQRRVRESDRVCRFELTAVTPILIGGYDTRTSHEVGREGLRPSSIKGVWRWWARIFVSAAICKRFRYTRFVNLEDADKIVANILGTTRDRASSSKYQIVATDLQVNEVELAKYKDVARVKLLRLGRGEIIRDRVLGPNSTFSVELYRLRKTEEAEDAFAASSLLVALALGGVGKATSRGFGKLAVTKVECNLSSVKELYSDLEKLSKGEIFREGSFQVKAKEIVKKIFELCINLASPLVVNMSVSGQYTHPLIETPVDNYYEVCIPNKLFGSDVEVLEAIGNATLKLSWKRLKGVDIRSSGRNLDTWILGLPRSQPPQFEPPRDRIPQANLEEVLRDHLKKLLNRIKCGNTNTDDISNMIRKKIEEDRRGREGGRREKYKVPTGYFNCCEKYKALVRRRSPIIFVPIKISDGEYKGKYYVVILGFITADWDRVSLIHLGFNWNYPHYFQVTFRPTQLNDVKRAFNTALDNVVKVIERSR
ncbi:MAG: type III-B CRISPR module RAMP protein Cmr1 [Thermofilaceae archaeon]|uniref:Type III-B CRISPR module RAMP protein Cmr1 n=1 Tax=Thermofilum pendens TaxID=2269 RepID=A0A7C4D3L2_THEPE